MDLQEIEKKMNKRGSGRKSASSKRGLDNFFTPKPKVPGSDKRSGLRVNYQNEEETQQNEHIEKTSPSNPSSNLEKSTINTIFKDTKEYREKDQKIEPTKKAIKTIKCEPRFKWNNEKLPYSVIQDFIDTTVSVLTTIEMKFFSLILKETELGSYKNVFIPAKRFNILKDRGQSNLELDRLEKLGLIKISRESTKKNSKKFYSLTGKILTNDSSPTNR